MSIQFSLPLDPVVLTKFKARHHAGDPGACWLWTGPTDGGGYGKLFVEGRYVGAHRVALILHLERLLLPGMQSLHTCDNPPCVNPTHLYEGTRKNNMRDAASRGRLVRPSGEAWKAAHGHETHRWGPGSAPSKFTEDQVASIRLRLKQGETRASLAREFNVSWVAINAIGSGKTYRRQLIDVIRIED